MDFIAVDYWIIFLFFVLIIASIAIYFIQDLLHAVIIYGVYTLIVALIWLLMNTPDLGLTEAAAGIGMTVLMMMVVFRTNRKEED